MKVPLTYKKDIYYKNVLMFLAISEDEYSFYFFDLGIKYVKMFQPNDMYLLKMKSFWRYFEKTFLVHVNSKYKEHFEKFYLRKNKENYEIFEKEFFNTIYEVEINWLKKNSKTVRKQETQPRTSKVKNNQLETNLNTI